MRVAIVGSRGYTPLTDVDAFVKGLAAKVPNAVVVSGGARGVDKAAEDAAVKYGLETQVYIPEWDRYGKVAGFLRNTQIVEDADVVVAFWDGVSRGTLDSIRKAKDMGKKVVLIPFREVP